MAKEGERPNSPPGETVGDGRGAWHTDPATKGAHCPTKLEIYGEEMIEKLVNASGNSGRVYLPPEWIGHKVKIARID